MTRRLSLVGALAFAAIAGLALAGPVLQDPAYHLFADRRRFLGISNFGNVASNLPFVLVGLAGLAWMSRPGSAAGFLDPRDRWAWGVHFAGQFLTGVGSAYYHWAPADAPLYWDRLPLTFVITSLAAAVVIERVDGTWGRRLLVPFVVAGAAAITSWRFGSGDLRPYAFVQFYPVVAIPLLLVQFPARTTRSGDYAGAVGWYAVAKLFEHFDAQVFRGTGYAVSGHTLKHLFAGLAGFWLLRMLALRTIDPATKPQDP